MLHVTFDTFKNHEPHTNRYWLLSKNVSASAQDFQPLIYAILCSSGNIHKMQPKCCQKETRNRVYVLAKIVPCGQNDISNGISSLST